jgi:adenylate cyclase
LCGRNDLKSDFLRRFHFALPFSVTLLTVVLAVLVPLSAALFGVGWYAVNTLQTANINLKIARAEETLTLLFVERMRSLAALQRQLAAQGEFADPPGGASEALARGRVLLSFVEQFPSLSAAYVGYMDGSYTLATLPARLSPERQRGIDAPPGTMRALWLISFNTGDRSESWIFLDQAGTVIGQRTIKDGDYDPRTRPWYEVVTRLHRQTMTDPYQFVEGGGIGITAAMPLRRDIGVLGADLNLNSLSSTLRQYKVSPSARMKVMTDSGDVLADSILDESGSRDSIPAREVERQIDAAMVGAMRELPDKAVEGDAKRLKIAGEPYFMLARALPPAIDKNLYLAVAIPAKEFTVETDELITRAAILALVAVSTATIIVVIVSRLLAQALERLTVQTQRFRRLDFSNTTMPRSSVREISRLAVAIDRMRSGLELFGRYIPKQIVRRLLDSDDAGKIGGVRRDVTVMFTDIQGFSAIGESIEPEVLMSRLSEYFNRIASAIIANRGTVDKYIGDGIMSVWNAPDTDPDHVANACRGALAILEASQELAEEWQRHGVPPFHTRIGIHRGLGVVGNVGSTDRMNYTLIGSIVNLASRLEGINKAYGTRILASAAVYDGVRDRFLWRQIDRVVPMGTSDVHDIYELIAERSEQAREATARWPERRMARWDEALALYLAGDFSDAHRAFDRLCAEFPDDKPSRVFAERCAVLEREGHPPNWDGVTRLVEK